MKHMSKYFLSIFLLSAHLNLNAIEIKDLQDSGEIKLSTGNVITFSRLCIDGLVFLYFKQPKSDGLTQVFVTDFQGNKVPLYCGVK